MHEIKTGKPLLEISCVYLTLEPDDFPPNMVSTAHAQAKQYLWKWYKSVVANDVPRYLSHVLASSGCQTSDTGRSEERRAGRKRNVGP